jgi:cysteine-rich repeat protein
VCGDGKVQAGVEQCDDGNDVDADKCTNECMNATCGDGIVWNMDGGTEQCDDMNGDNNDACVMCKTATCGDGQVWNKGGGTEQCDDMNGDNNDACVMCKTAVCGDGQVWNKGGGTEQCDDMNANNNDACVMCKTAICGDGHVWSQGGGMEQCDGNVGLKANTVCTMNTCQLQCKPQSMSEAWGNCDGNIVSNGCEADLKVDAKCGECMEVCEMAETCTWNSMDKWICIQ